MENKTAMTFLMEKILRMPESNIKGFLKISGPAYLESEKEQIKDACENGFMWSAEGWNGEMISYYKDGNETLESHKEEYYNETYGN